MSVVFDGVTYTDVPFDTKYSLWGATRDESLDYEINFSEYPFAIYVYEEAPYITEIFTESAGTYDIEIIATNARTSNWQSGCFRRAVENVVWATRNVPYTPMSFIEFNSTVTGVYSCDMYGVFNGYTFETSASIETDAETGDLSLVVGTISINPGDPNHLPSELTELCYLFVITALYNRFGDSDNDIQWHGSSFSMNSKAQDILPTLIQNEQRFIIAL